MTDRNDPAAARVRSFGWKRWICAHSHRWMSEDASKCCPVCGTITFREDNTNEA